MWCAFRCVRPSARRGGLVRRSLAALSAAALAVVAACSGGGDSTAPGGRPSTTRIALAASIGPIAQETSSPATLRVAIAYLRAAGDSVPLGVQTFTLGTTGTQQLPMTVDLSGCLTDAGRRGAEVGTGANAVCDLRLDLTLLQGATVLDQEVVTPVVARPGQTTAVDGAVALYTVATVNITPPVGVAPGAPARVVLGQTLALAAIPVDATGQPVARPTTWTSDNPTVATVDSLTGLVTPHAAGSATITATAGGRSASIGLVVSPATATITVAVAGGLGTGTVTSAPAGITCQVAAGAATGACSAVFPGNVPVALTATPAVGSSFASWGGDCATAGTLLTCQLAPTAPRTAAVTFVAFRALAVTLAGNGDGSVTSQPAGVSCQLTGGTTSGACTGSYLDGTSVTLTAAPSAMSSFAGWTGACATASLSCTVTLNQAQGVTATFTHRQATLMLTVGGSGAGTVTASGAGVLGNGTCALAAGVGSTTCTIPVQVGGAVTLTATAAGTSSFGGWAGACATTTGAACPLTIVGDVGVGAVFTVAPVSLSVAPAAGNAGAGLVSTVDNAIACAVGGATTNGSCQADVPVGATVTLRVAPAANQVFLGWGGACAASNTAATCTLVVTTSTRVTVAFAPPQPLTLTLSGSGGGTVSGTAPPCALAPGSGSMTCTTAQTYGTTVTLTASPDQGTSAFTGWGGACQPSGTAPSCTITLDQARAVTAGFQLRTATITLALSGSAGGNVLRSGATVCTLPSSGGSTSCQLTVPVASSVSFSAQPVAAAQFNGWAGPCTGTGACTFVVGGDVTLAATFVPVPVAVSISADQRSTGSGAVASAPPGIACTITGATASGACTTSVPAGAQVTLTATAAAGNSFAGWGGACAGQTTTTCTLATVTTATAATARFASSTATLTLAADPASTGTGSLFSTDERLSCQINGTAASGTCSATYTTLPASVVLRAANDVFTQFIGWTGVSCPEGNASSTCTVTLVATQTVRANFYHLPTSIVIPSATGVGSGTLVVSSPINFSCTLAPGGASSACQFTVPTNAQVHLAVTPDVNTASATWAGACAGQGAPNCTFVATGASNPAVVYSPRQYTVSVVGNQQNAGTGTITSTPAGISCTVTGAGVTGTCSAPFAAGTNVQVTESARTGSGFGSWGGACAGTGAGATCQLSALGADASVTAVFTATVSTLTLAPTNDGTGAGSITGPPGVGGSAPNCTYNSGQLTGRCTQQYAGAPTVSLSATPMFRSAIQSWTGACAGTAATSTTCSVPMTQAQTAGVVFTGPYTIGVVAAPGTNTGTGTVTGTAAVNCTVAVGVLSGACSAVYDVAQSITYTAAPDANSYFSGWSSSSGAYCGGLASLQCTFTATQPGVARAGFLTASTFELDAGNAEVSGTTFGAVTVSTAGRADATFAATAMSAANPRFGRGNTVVLRAAPNANSRFTGWGGDCQAFGTSLTCTLTNYAPVPGNQSGLPVGQVIANFDVAA